MTSSEPRRWSRTSQRRDDARMATQQPGLQGPARLQSVGMEDQQAMGGPFVRQVAKAADLYARRSVLRDQRTVVDAGDQPTRDVAGAGEADQACCRASICSDRDGGAARGAQRPVRSCSSIRRGPAMRRSGIPARRRPRPRRRPARGPGRRPPSRRAVDPARARRPRRRRRPCSPGAASADGANFEGASRGRHAGSRRPRLFGDARQDDSSRGHGRERRSKSCASRRTAPRPVPGVPPVEKPSPMERSMSAMPGPSSMARTSRDRAPSSPTASIRRRPRAA